MINTHDILETINMIQDENLDIRTITMGISLLDCCTGDAKSTCNKIYEKMTRKAENLVKTGEDIEKEYGIPIINKRISVTPISMILASGKGDPVLYAKTLERVAQTVDYFNNSGIKYVGACHCTGPAIADFAEKVDSYVKTSAGTVIELAD